MLTVAAARRLPHVILEREKDAGVTSLGTDGLNGLSLQGGATAGLTIAVTLAGPAGLQVDDLVAGANGLQELHLLLDEGTGARGHDVGVEVGVDVSTSDVNLTANGGGDILSLPDVERLRDGVRSLVTGAFALDNLDKLGKLVGSAAAVHDGLVTDNHEADHVPLSPLGDGVNLLLDIGRAGRARALDEDTNDHAHAVLLASGSNGLIGVAVSRVNTDGAETSLLEGGNVLVDLASRLAVTAVRSVGSVGNTVKVVGAAEAARGLARLGSRLRSRLRSGLGGRLRSRLGGRSGSLSGQTNAGERAVGDVASLSDGDNLLGSSVGTGVVAGRGRVHDDGLLSDGGGVRVDRVGTGAGADVGGHDDNAGGNVFAGAHGGDGASDGGGGLDNGRDTTDGVSAGGNLGGGSAADGGGLSDGESRSRERVSAGRRASRGVRSRDDDNLSGGSRRGRHRLRGSGRRRRLDRRSEGESLGLGASGSDGRGGLSSRRHD